MSEPTVVVTSPAPVWEATVVIENDAPVTNVVVEDVSPAGPPGVAGPPGPTGPEGPQGSNGQPRFSGYGPPGLVLGAEPNDEYLDKSDGTIYTLT